MTEKIDGDIDRLFSEELLPLAARLKGGNARLLESQLQRGAASYFVNRPKTSMAKGDFETGGCASPQTVQADLAAAWSGSDTPALAALAPGMAKLACNLRQVQEESGEVSNFIYVMY